VGVRKPGFIYSDGDGTTIMDLFRIMVETA